MNKNIKVMFQLKDSNKWLIGYIVSEFDIKFIELSNGDEIFLNEIKEYKEI